MSNYPVRVFADGTKCYSGPNCRRHGGLTATDNIDAADFESRMKKLDSLYPVDPIRKETPDAIDGVLAEIYTRYYNALDGIDRTVKYIEDYEKSLKPTYRYYREYDVPRITVSLEKQKLTLEAQQAAAEKILDEANPGEEEFNRRGGWTRAFLVTNNGGHIHKKRSCSTCYSTTRFVWLPEYSGKKEEEIIEDAGKQACTVCYPNAPVETLKRPSVIEAPDRKAARLIREKEKAIRDAKKIEKGILNVDGSEIKLKGDFYSRYVTSAGTAERTAVDILTRRIERAERNYGNNRPEAVVNETADYDMLLAALSHKFNRTEEEQHKILSDKSRAKFKREWK
jgi:hypothetical protein